MAQKCVLLLELPHSAICCLGLRLWRPTIMLVSQEPIFGGSIWPGLVHKPTKSSSSPLFLTPRKYINRIYYIKLNKVPSSAVCEITEYKMASPFSNNNSFNTTNSFNNAWNYTVAEEKSRILAWLSPLDPWNWHEDIRARRVDGVGDWLFQTDEYRKWFDGRSGCESDGSALFCHGGPGVGKTYIW